MSHWLLGVLYVSDYHPELHDIAPLALCGVTTRRLRERFTM